MDFKISRKYWIIIATVLLVVSIVCTAISVLFVIYLAFLSHVVLGIAFVGLSCFVGVMAIVYAFDDE